MSDMALAIQRSNLSPSAKANFLDRWIGMARGATRSTLAKVGVHGMQGVETVAHMGTGGLFGVIAGYAHATTGLDATFRGEKVPMDAIAAGGLGLLSIFAARMPGARLAGGGAGTLTGIFAFRKTFDFFATKRRAAGKPVGGTFAGDEDAWCAPGVAGGAQEELMNLASGLG